MEKSKIQLPYRVTPLAFPLTESSIDSAQRLSKRCAKCSGVVSYCFCYLSFQHLLAAPQPVYGNEFYEVRSDLGSSLKHCGFIKTCGEEVLITQGNQEPRELNSKQHHGVIVTLLQTTCFCDLSKPVNLNLKNILKQENTCQPVYPKQATYDHLLLTPGYDEHMQCDHSVFLLRWLRGTKQNAVESTEIHNDITEQRFKWYKPVAVQSVNKSCAGTSSKCHCSVSKIVYLPLCSLSTHHNSQHVGHLRLKRRQLISQNRLEVVSSPTLFYQSPSRVFADKIYKREVNLRKQDQFVLAIDEWREILITDLWHTSYVIENRIIQRPEFKVVSAVPQNFVITPGASEVITEGTNLIVVSKISQAKQFPLIAFPAHGDITFLDTLLDFPDYLKVHSLIGIWLIS